MAARMSTRPRSCNHHEVIVLRDVSRTGRTRSLAHANGASYLHAESKGADVPKSIIHIERERLVKSRPFAHGTTTSEFGCPCGFGEWSNSIAAESGMSKAPPFVSPMNEMRELSLSLRAVVVSVLPPRFALIFATGEPSNRRTVSAPSSNPTIETWTFAPSRTQSRSLTAKKMSPVFLILLSTSRFAPPRIPCVASKPTRCTFFRSIICRPFSNQ